MWALTEMANAAISGTYQSDTLEKARTNPYSLCAGATKANLLHQGRILSPGLLLDTKFQQL